MPLVTVASRPKGDPMATTFSPTWMSADLPIVAGCSPETPSALITARSVTGSVPTIVAFLAEPSLKLTVIWPPWPTEATWLFVRISPSDLITMPDPDPCSWEFATLILTTEGRTEAATCSTESAAGGTSLRLTTGELVLPDAVEVAAESSPPRLSTAVNPAAPATPATPPTASAAARMPAITAPPGRPGRPGWLGWLEGAGWSPRNPSPPKRAVSGSWYGGRGGCPKGGAAPEGGRLPAGGHR